MEMAGTLRAWKQRVAEGEARAFEEAVRREERGGSEEEGGVEEVLEEATGAGVLEPEDGPEPEREAADAT